MKLSFSTLGCPDWSFPEIYSTAADLGYNGIEIRGVEDEMHVPKIPAFQGASVKALMDKLAGLNLEIPILTGGAYICGCDDIGVTEFEVKDYIMLAGKLGCPYVRVLAESSPEPSGSFDMDKLATVYAKLCEFAAGYGVILLVETNGALAESSKMKELLLLVNHKNAGVLWDIHHTYRFFGEKPEYTAEFLGDYIKHVHIKDSVKGSNGVITYMLTGYGDIPITEAVGALKSIGYTGYLSYEWLKRWARDLAEPGVAFYQYINYIRELL